MTNIEIVLLDGTTYKTSVENYNSQEIEDMINVQDKIVVAIGGVVVNRHNVKAVVESEA